MQRLNERHGAAIHIQALLHLATRIGSRGDTSDLAEPVAAALDLARATLTEWETARTRRLAASSGIAWLDGRVDDRTMDVSRAALLVRSGRVSNWLANLGEDDADWLVRAWRAA